ncbi:hypothetical protein Tco_1405714 [Tanacetum coccineum]
MTSEQNKEQLSSVAQTSSPISTVDIINMDEVSSQYNYVSKCPPSYLTGVNDGSKWSSNYEYLIVTTSRYVVPTGRVKVPAGRYVVPTGKDNVIVSASRSKVISAGRTILVLVVLLGHPIRRIYQGRYDVSVPTLHTRPRRNKDQDQYAVSRGTPYAVFNLK